MSDSFRPNKIRFQFEGRLLNPIILLVGGIFLLIFFGYYGYIRSGLSLGYCLSMLIMFSIIGFVYYLRAFQFSSDLELDDSGMSRFLFGVKWRELTWHEIKVIRMVKQNSPDGFKLIWYLSVYPYDRDKGWIPTKSRIMFTERTGDREELQDQLNHYIKQYGIIVFKKTQIVNGSNRWKQVESINFGS